MLPHIAPADDLGSPLRDFGQDKTSEHQLRDMSGCDQIHSANSVMQQCSLPRGPSALALSTAACLHGRGRETPAPAPSYTCVGGRAVGLRWCEM